MALVGNLKDIKLPTLVQINCMERNTAKLTIEHMGRFGFIYFHEGQVVHAEYDPLIGEEAFLNYWNFIRAILKLKPKCERRRLRLKKLEQSLIRRFT